MTGTAKFLTIRQTAKLGLLSEYQLRLWQKQGKLPGIYTGNTFRVNVPMLERKLEERSAQGGMEG